MGSILLLVCLIRSGSLLNHRNAALVEQQASRAAVSDAIKSGAIQGKWIVTDQPDGSSMRIAFAWWTSPRVHAAGSCMS